MFLPSRQAIKYGTANNFEMRVCIAVAIHLASLHVFHARLAKTGHSARALVAKLDHAEPKVRESISRRSRRFASPAPRKSNPQINNIFRYQSKVATNRWRRPIRITAEENGAIAVFIQMSHRFWAY